MKWNQFQSHDQNLAVFVWFVCMFYALRLFSLFLVTSSSFHPPNIVNLFLARTVIDCVLYYTCAKRGWKSRWPLLFPFLTISGGLVSTYGCHCLAVTVFFSSFVHSLECIKWQKYKWTDLFTYTYTHTRTLKKAITFNRIEAGKSKVDTKQQIKLPTNRTSKHGKNKQKTQYLYLIWCMCSVAFV